MDVGASATSGIVVLDESGAAFALLRTADLDVPLFRATRMSTTTNFNAALTIVATYGAPDWQMISDLAESSTILILASRVTHDDALHAVAVGAIGYVDAYLGAEALRRSILGALKGEHAYSRRLLATLIRNGRFLRASNTLPLTPRQREVITLIARGAADKEIARALGITTATAQKHVTNLLRRLKVPNRAAAVAVMASTSPM